MNRPAIRLALGCSDFALGKMWEIVCHFGLKDPIDSIWRFPKMGVTMGNPKSSIFIGFSIINHSFWGTHIYRNLIETSMRSFALRHHVFATATKSPAITNYGSCFTSIHPSTTEVIPILKFRPYFFPYMSNFFHTISHFWLLQHVVLSLCRISLCRMFTSKEFMFHLCRIPCFLSHAQKNQM